MSHKTTARCINVSLTVVLALVLLVAGCKKAPPEDQNNVPPRPAVTSEKQATTAKPAATAEKTGAASAAKPAGTGKSAEMVPIDIKLPKPMFVGTPQSFQGVANLEKPLGKPRPPFYAPKGTKNISLGKPVTASDEEPIIGEIAMITDGDKEAADGSYVELGPFLQYVTIDLGAEYNIYAIVIWHYHKQARVYHDVVVQVADDADFIANVHTVFNNDDDNSAGLGTGSDKNYVETSEGKLIDAKGVKGRYVRCYSNGNSSNDLNNYIEVEVFGKPAQ